MIAVPAGQASSKVALVMVSGFIGSLKLAVISVLMATPVVLPAGLVELTVGAVMSGPAPVVKLQSTALTMALPATSLAPVVTRAEHVVLAGRLLAGVNVATFPLTAYPTDPVTGAPTGHARVKFATVIVRGFIDSLKLAVISVLMGTLLALAAGLVELTVGEVVSGAAPVAKDQLNSVAKALCATSVTPVPIRAKHKLLAGRASAGVNVATFPFTA